MGIYRGPGGTGDAVSDASSQAAITVIARDEALAAKNAAQLAQAGAELAKTGAQTAQTAAASSATAAATSATASATSATSSASSASSASTSASNAATSASNAATSETNAAAYELSANNWATKTSGPVAGGEYSAKYNAQLAATSATSAGSSATAASTSASAASTSATNAASSASSASTSATNAANSATSASGSATAASSSASSASTSATDAASSATSAAGSATTATTQAGLASTSATNAASSASAASTSASNATTSATNAASSATSAASAQVAAESARDATLAAYDSFDDRYLGVKASDPTVDNDGNALVAGALYFNSTSGVMRVYNGTAWVAAYVSGAGVLLIANNLSDLQSAATARTNLGLGTAATTNSTAYATAAQGATADTAYADRYKWDGGATGLVAATGRTSLGVTATGSDTTYAYRANNLSDLSSASTARTNLGLGTAATTNSTDYATAAQALTAGGTAGQILAKNSSTNYDAAWIDNYATQVKFQAKNVTGSTITKGSVVYVSGGAGANPYIAKAQANGESTSASTVGILESDVANNGFGLVVVKGVITGIDTSAATDGDPVWLSPTTAGGMAFGVANKPAAPNHLVYLGTVTRASATQGEVQIQISNGWEIEELHNVSVTSPSDGQLLTWEASTSLWKNKAAPISLPSQTGNSGKYLTTDGSTASWGTITAGASLSNDTSTASNLYPLFAAATSGTPTTIYTSNSKYLYNPSTGTLQSPVFNASNGIYINNMTVATSVSIPSGSSAMSVGPITVAAGQTVTVPSGSRWVIL